MSNEYESLRAGFEYKVALQAIRKVIRSSDTDDIQKVKDIVNIVHSFEDDLESAELAAEHRATAADEAEFRRQKIDEMFEELAEPVNKLMQSVNGTGDQK